MQRQTVKLETIAVLFAGILVLASCKSEPQPAPAPPPPAAAPRMQSSVTTKPGVAGGVSEAVFIVESIVSAVDVPNRLVTLKGSDGRQFTFTAGPEIRNLPQLHVGDKVTATFARRMVVTVRSDDAPPSVTQTELQESAELGEKPGALIAEETTKVARVNAVDSVNRTADLEFADGVVKRIPVRADVDLSRYKVGDRVVIRVTRALTLLVESPRP